MSYNNAYGINEDGKLAVRVIGAGGGGGSVSSVNGKTGAVVLNAEDVDAIPQVSELPTADESNLGNIVQYVGATTENYTNGYFYKCVSDGQSPATYSWQQVNVQPSSGGGSTALSLTLPSANWVNNSITVTASGVTASNNVIVSPAPASQSAYTSSGVLCTAQSTDSLTFTCTQTPSVDLTVTALII